MGKLRLYQVDFEPSDNFYIEDIESYLKTLPSTAKREEWGNLDYLKLGMNLTIKLPLNQVHQIENSCNYAIIEQDTNTYYYFVVDAKWIAKSTIQLVLTLDTVQTFFPRLRWSDKTQITRETQNRLVKLNTNYYLRKIDKYNEGFNPAKVKEVNRTPINSALGGKWYLVYMSNPATTQDKTGNPMFMGLLSNVSYKIYNAVSGDPYNWVLDSSKVYYITESNAVLKLTTTAGGAPQEFSLGDTIDGNKISRAFRIYYSAGVFHVIKLYYTGDTYPYSFSDEKEAATVVATGNTIVTLRVLHVVDDTDYNRGITNIDKLDALPSITINAGTLPEVKTTAYRDFDDSNSRLSKIIELPYAPLSITKNSDGTYNFADCTFNYGYNILQINTKRLSTVVKEDTRLQDLLYVTITNPTATDKPNIDLESKLYSSEFYDYAYYYDTDKQPIRLEDISTNMLNCSINIYYNTTTTMNSDKQFYFAIHNATYDEMQPYELYLNCARSTEQMILNDSYAEYIKDGYNYDLWNQKRSEKLATINTLISGIQAGLSLVGPASRFAGAIGTGISSGIKMIQTSRDNKMLQDLSSDLDSDGTQGIPILYEGLKKQIASNQQMLSDISNNAKAKARGAFKASTGIGALVLNNGANAVLSAYNSYASIESSQRSFSNAVNSRANTPIAASGSVPTDLFDNYSSNKLTRYEYTIKPEDRTNLFNTFRLTGYSHPVQEKPVFNTRIYSNFVQCKPVFLNSLTEIYKVYLDDISLRFQAGVTVKHNYKGKYDLYDEYENYETIVMEE